MSGIVGKVLRLFVVLTIIGLTRGHFLDDTEKDREDANVKAIYDGSSVDELIGLCGGAAVLDSETYASFNLQNPVCLPIENGLDPDRLGPLGYAKRREERWVSLRSAQWTLRGFRAKLHRKTYIAQFALLGIATLCGLYLIIVGHFSFRTIYDPYVHDPTTGIPCWQYLRMGYVAATKPTDNDSGKAEKGKDSKWNDLQTKMRSASAEPK